MLGSDCCLLICIDVRGCDDADAGVDVGDSIDGIVVVVSRAVESDAKPEVVRVGNAEDSEDADADADRLIGIVEGG